MTERPLIFIVFIIKFQYFKFLVTANYLAKKNLGYWNFLGNFGNYWENMGKTWVRQGGFWDFKRGCGKAESIPVEVPTRLRWRDNGIKKATDWPPQIIKLLMIEA
jgi:hypothetical protein